MQGRIQIKTPLSPARPEILSGGFIDIIQNGQMNASARLLKLYIGEPGRFQVPVSVYTGVSANNTGNNKINEELVHNFINPGTGFFNISFDGSNRLAGHRDKLTSLQLQYMAGMRILSATNYLTQKAVSVFNNIETLGISFVTGAWEKNKTGNMGVFWLNGRAIFSVSPQNVLDDIFNPAIKNNMLGYSLGMGIEISQAVNIKLFYYRYQTRQKTQSFDPPFFQASFNYSLK